VVVTSQQLPSLVKFDTLRVVSIKSDVMGCDIVQFGTRLLAFFFNKHANLKIEAAINIIGSLPRSLTILKHKKAKFKVALRKYLNICPFYLVDKFFMCKDDLQYCFLNVCSTLHCKNCVYLYPYDLFHTPLFL
jgi:hypothetical protein